MSTVLLKRASLGVCCIALLAGSTSCAISKGDCIEGDWEGIGYRDGQNGRSPNELNAYAKTCAKHNVTPDSSAYTAGFNAGIVLYCKPENGFKEGSNDQAYAGSCPMDLEPLFVAKYVDGLELASSDLEFEYDKLESELEVLRDRRLRRIAEDRTHNTIDKDIKKAQGRLEYVVTQRRSVSEKLREWLGYSKS